MKFVIKNKKTKCYIESRHGSDVVWTAVRWNAKRFDHLLHADSCCQELPDYDLEVLPL